MDMRKLIYALLFMLYTSDVSAQLASTKLAGVWLLVAVENIRSDGSKTLPYGSDPVGMLVFNDDGSYAIQILKASRPRVAANDKNKATHDENAALVQGNNSHFGRYKVNKQDRTIFFYIDHAFYPNWEGEVQQRTYTLENNLLKYVVTNTTNGGDVTATVVWRRRK
jgi:hypothetical protein